MFPAPDEHFRRSTYCHVHHCYSFMCTSLYGYQAYLLQPKCLKIKAGSIHQIIQDAGRSESIRGMAPKSKYNILAKVRARQLGLR